MRENMPVPVLARLPDGIRAGRFAAASDCPWHVHEGMELVLVVEGRVEILVGGACVPGTVGDLLVLPARVPQYQRSLGFVRTHYVHFQCPVGLLDDHARGVPVGMADVAARWMDDLCQLYLETETRGGATAAVLLLALVERLGELERRQATRATLHPGIAKALDGLHRQPARAWQVAELAELAGLSPSHFGALFASQIGRSPIVCLAQVRMELARRLLLDPQAQVKAVAASCGYPDVNYFVRQFRRHHGAPPAGWRKAQLAACRRDWPGASRSEDG